ncbi:hypothetical protein GYMLUDRAFT_88288 [Collybiopsis luxurians FD-317 M1]|uniref:Uncharacterized protein n=1 Tax=Collybiopsis luxurians FD-317 M1 TaxID=944289 RepID=A0A0D0BGW8_9AGAR|nr:hypothetical protein GYMLUDRAFT_88288 [Collybiopsis luxurians FD-317 M1]
MGAGESGNNSALKKMKEFQHLKILSEGGYTDGERESYKAVIFNSLIQSVREILDVLSYLDLDVAEENVVHLATVLAEPFDLEVDFITQDVGNVIRRLRRDPAVKEVIRRSKEYQLNDSAVYYLNAVDRISLPDYLPTDQDILKRAEKNSGLTEIILPSGELTYKLYHVGNQRSEWRKSMYLFDNVTALVFLVNISEYDQILYEDESISSLTSVDFRQNCLQEALILFDQLCNSKWFANTSIILFLNGIEIFAEKLPNSPVDHYFPDYNGGDNYDAACEYFLHRFVSLNQYTAQRQFYVKYTPDTVGIDDSGLKFILNAVEDIILQLHLRSGGLMSDDRPAVSSESLA